MPDFGAGFAMNPAVAQLKVSAARKQPVHTTPLYVVGQPKGLLEPGTLDLNHRPVVHNEDGTISTEYSTSFGDERGREILVPTVVNGKFLTESGTKPEEGSAEEKEMFRRAAEHYYKTGEHLGIFSSPENADSYAQQVHNRQDIENHPPGSPSNIP